MKQESLEKFAEEIEGPYELPEGWRWVRLGDKEIIKINRENRNPTKDILADEFVYIDITGIEGGTGRIKEVKKFQWKNAPSRARRVIYTNDVVMSTVRPYLKAFAIVPQEYDNQICSTGFAVLSCNNNLLLPRYLLYSLFSDVVIEQCNKMMIGAHYPALNVSQVSELQIPLPPLAEQKRIVARIEQLFSKIDEIKRLRKEALEQAKALLPSALHQVFSKADEKGWRWVRLGEIFDIQQGVSMSPKRRMGISPYPFLRTSNVYWGFVDLSSLDYMDFTEEEVSKLKLQPGDLLVCEGGEVGRSAVWKGEIQTCLYQNHIHRLRKSTDKILPEFYMYWMEFAFKVMKLYRGEECTTAIPNLSIGRLKKFEVPLPPLSEQKRIVAYLDKIQEKALKLQKLQQETEKEIERLRESVLYKAFRGEL